MDEGATTAASGAQREALNRAREAASAGDALGMVAALHQSGLLGGLTQRLSARWRRIPPEEMEWIVSQAVDALHGAVVAGKGNRIRRIEDYLFKAAFNIACDHNEGEKQFVHDPLVLERVAVEIDGQTPWGVVERCKQVPRESSPEQDTTPVDVDRTALALQVARIFLPVLGQGNLQAVVGYLLDAYEAGYWDVPHKEIAKALGLTEATVRKSKERGFSRLVKRARAAGMWDKGFDFEEFIHGLANDSTKKNAE